MFKKKNKQIKTSPNKSNLDQVLWFIENYLPQKKDRGVQKKLYMDNLEAETITKFSKLASMRSKTLFPIIRSAIFFSLISLFASFVPKNSLIVDIPLLLAILATFLAGSIPKMGIFFF